MQVYLVGGAVRDALLGLPVTERDWVVVGATPEELEAAGYRAVGRDFPVFLHPETREEHALARLERKTGAGYRGFSTDFAPHVTLEEDLRRRDLTINAIAQSASGTLIDPHGGQADLRARLLRHVSAAFSEDPLRVLRVARFAARFAALGFTIAPETLALMRRMAAGDELDTLSPERIWRETERALDSSRPERFFSVLRTCGALARVMPELDSLLQKSPQGATALAALRAVADAQGDGPARWTALVGELNKHDLDVLQARLRVPGAYADMASLHRRLATLLHGGHLSQESFLTDATQLLKLLETADALRRPERFESWLKVHAGRELAAGHPARQTRGTCQRLERAQKAIARVKLAKDDLERLQGPKLAERLHEKRLDALRRIK
jgi:tRNA nucleotidyltransferase (CCA-adding enzyme)